MKPHGRPGGPAVVGGAVVLGAVAASVAVERGTDPAVAVIDASVAVALAACGVVARTRRPASRIGALMVVAATTWLAGTLWPALVFVHRGSLAHVYLTHPTGRLRAWTATVVIAVYVVALVEPVARAPGVSLATAAVVTSAAAATYVSSTGPARGTGAPALAAALAFSGALTFAAANQLWRWELDRLALWIYDAAIAGSVLMLTVDLVRGRRTEAAVAGMVMRLGASPLDAVPVEIGQALGDRGVTLAIWDGPSGCYRDGRGLVDLAELAPGRVTRHLTQGGEPIGLLLYDAAADEDPGLVTAVAAAAKLAVLRERSRAHAVERVVALTASRRRTLRAVDTERERFRHELASGARAHLVAARDLLATASARVDHSDDDLAADLRDLETEAAATVADLDRLTTQRAPIALEVGGLAAAIEQLASRADVPVAVAVDAEDVALDVAVTAYFVCAEALANALKHATASSVSISVVRHERAAVIVVVDDGVGGASVGGHSGTGLRGLAERVEALGGALSIRSAPGVGTTVEAQLPLG